MILRLSVTANETGETARALLSSEELSNINIGGNVRAPLVLHLKEKDSGQELLFMVNHLYRSDADARHSQAQLLNDWAAQQTLPVVTVGDFNFDWDVQTGQHDKGYDLMVADGRYEWVKPETLVTTQCSGWPCAFESVLDFVFVAGPAKNWLASSDIVVADGDFPDDETTSDHRPVRVTLNLSVVTVGVFLPVVLGGAGAQANCDPSYPTVCIPPPPPDLDCGDIPYRNFTVLPPDPHNFDGNSDGIGCQS